MAWTYTGTPFAGDLTVSPPVFPTQQQNRDSVRFLIDDTDPSHPLLQDGEVDGLLNANKSGGTGHPDPYLAAVQACTTLIARYVRRANRTVGDLSVEYTNMADDFRALRASIRQDSMRHSAVPIPYAGGQSLADMNTDQEDDDLNQPWATIGMDDNEGAQADNNAGSTFSQAVPSG